jgi:hypothetical protein
VSPHEREWLPEGWDADVIEDEWPDALIAAIRIDAGAVGAPRAVATLRAWRTAQLGPASNAREVARAAMLRVAEALTASSPPRHIPTERLDTLALLGPRTPLLPSSPEHITDAAVPTLSPPRAEPAQAQELTAWAYDRPGWVPDDASEDAIDPLLADLVGSRGPALAAPAVADADDGDDDADDTAYLEAVSPTPRPPARAAREPSRGRPAPDRSERPADRPVPEVQDRAAERSAAERTQERSVVARAPVERGVERSGAERSSERGGLERAGAERSSDRSSAERSAERSEDRSRVGRAPADRAGPEPAPSLRLERAAAEPAARPERALSRRALEGRAGSALDTQGMPKIEPAGAVSAEFVEDEPPTTAIPVAAIRGPSAAPRPLPPPLPPASTVAPPAAPSSADRRGPARPGVVRRTPGQTPEPARPRAALVQVRALYSAILPLCRELVPLSPERRARRFWTHWREASGDRGVRREVAEQLLESARDVRGLASALIAEVQSVDLDSVRALVERLDAEAELTEGLPVRGTEERARGPLVGAVVRVEALPFEPEE